MEKEEKNMERNQSYIEADETDWHQITFKDEICLFLMHIQNLIFHLFPFMIVWNHLKIKLFQKMLLVETFATTLAVAVKFAKDSKYFTLYLWKGHWTYTIHLQIPP